MHGDTKFKNSDTGDRSVYFGIDKMRTRTRGIRLGDAHSDGQTRTQTGGCGLGLADCRACKRELTSKYFPLCGYVMGVDKRGTRTGRREDFSQNF